MQVTPYNIAYLQELVRNGPTAYLSVRYVERDTGDSEQINLQYNKHTDAFLQYRWIIEWHIKDREWATLSDFTHQILLMLHSVQLVTQSAQNEYDVPSGQYYALF